MNIFHEIRVAVLVGCLSVVAAGIAAVASIEFFNSTNGTPPIQATPKLALAERW